MTAQAREPRTHRALAFLFSQYGSYVIRLPFLLLKRFRATNVILEPSRIADLTPVEFDAVPQLRKVPDLLALGKVPFPSAGQLGVNSGPNVDAHHPAVGLEADDFVGWNGGTGVPVVELDIVAQRLDVVIAVAAGLVVAAAASHHLRALPQVPEIVEFPLGVHLGPDVDGLDVVVFIVIAVFIVAFNVVVVVLLALRSSGTLLSITCWLGGLLLVLLPR